MKKYLVVFKMSSFFNGLKTYEKKTQFKNKTTKYFFINIK